MATASFSSILSLLLAVVSGELLQNGGFESLDHWVCGGFQCSLTSDKHSGQHGVKVTGRSQYYQGPGQYIQVTSGHTYKVSAWAKLLSDHSGQTVDLEVAFDFPDGTRDFQPAAIHDHAHTSEGWFHLQGTFTVPSKTVTKTLLYFQSRPDASVNFIVDEASVTDQSSGGGSTPGVGSQTGSHSTAGNLLQNPGFESTSVWDCGGFHCSLSNDRHSGQHSLQASGRSRYNQGPGQVVSVKPGHTYHVGAWAKIASDYGGQTVDIEVAFHYQDGHYDFSAAAVHENARTSEGWFYLEGSFTVPSKPMHDVRLYFQSRPSAGVNFLVDEASCTELAGGGPVTTASLNKAIDQHRKSNINFHVTTVSGINKADVKIHVLQKKKSFPFGSAINSWKYNENAGGGKYRDFIHKHFNWAVPENALKWPVIEAQRGHKNYQTALDMIHGVKSHGIKVRGHNLVWSKERFVQDWVKALSGNALRTEVKQHIQETMSKTRGLLEHWDVNNENLHGTWFQDRLHDPNYDIELFREAHQADPSVKLFLNDYNVVATGASTSAYLTQAQKIKGANVGLSGMGVQCHFGNEHEPDPTAVWGRLDILAKAGIPIWATELDVLSVDENKRATFYEKALRALYAHPAVKGILFWGFWDQAHYAGTKASMVQGGNLQPNAAGRRVLDLLENQWMTDVTETLSQSGNTFTVRGFHGDYEVHVMYQGRDLGSLKQTFTLGKAAHTVNINVHT
ncbi:uncharacterized protein [Littorina saxatilis]|uniref:uncharacterized protein n=1 Tax=Littorina saxatilis TaxID=31220 RepID=UPI0038B576F9